MKRIISAMVTCFFVVGISFCGNAADEFAPGGGRWGYGKGPKFEMGFGKKEHTGRQNALFGLLIAMSVNQRVFMGSCTYGTNYCDNYYQTAASIAGCHSSGGTFSSSMLCSPTDSVGYCRMNAIRDVVFYTTGTVCNSAATCRVYCNSTLHGFYFANYPG